MTSSRHRSKEVMDGGVMATVAQQPTSTNNISPSCQYYSPDWSVLSCDHNQYSTTPTSPESPPDFPPSLSSPSDGPTDTIHSHVSDNWGEYNGYGLPNDVPSASYGQNKPTQQRIKRIDMSAITFHDIKEHNTRSYWYAWKGKVYDVAALYKHWRPRIHEEIRNNPTKMSIVTRINKNPDHIMFSLSYLGVCEQERDDSLPAFYVGDISLQGVEDTLSHIEHLVECCPTDDDEEGFFYMYDVCVREHHKLAGNNDEGKEEGNSGVFPLPYGVLQGALREWLDSWGNFETFLENDECAWSLGQYDSVDFDCDMDSDGCFKSSLRTWLEDWATFNHEITGETAWEVLPPDVIKYDAILPEQEVLVASRKKHKDLNYTGRMRKRRLALAEYFKRYHVSSEKMESYLKFSQRLEENKRQLESLCNEEH